MSNSIKLPNKRAHSSPSTHPDSKEAVALALTMDIMENERLYGEESPEEASTDYRKYLLDLYKECLTATMGHR